MIDLNDVAFEELNGYQKTAIFLFLIGHNKASEVLKVLDLNHNKEIRRVLSVLAPVRSELGNKIFKHFLADAEQIVVSESPQEFQRALSEQKSMANSLLDEGVAADNVRGLEELKNQAPDTIYNIISGCHPQIVATILAYLDDGKSASVLELYSPERRNMIIKNISQMKTIKPTALKDLALILERQNQSEDGGTGHMSIGGSKTAANILNQLTPGLEEKALAFIAEEDELLAEEIKDKMFMFVDLLTLEPTSMQKVVATIEQDTLIVALKGAAEDIIKKFIEAMSKRQAERFVEELEDKPRVKAVEVNEAQKQILMVVRKLHDKGEIFIPGKGDEYV